MTEPALVDRDRTAVDALVADRYLDALLAANDRRADDAPADAALDPELRAAAATLRRALVRVHPSFRFEERLAARLADLALTGTPERRERSGIVLPFRRRGAAGELADPMLEAILAGEIDPAATEPAREAGGTAATSRPGASGVAGPARPWITAGAIVSAGLSLAGVAYVAWRAGRGSRRDHPALVHGVSGEPA